MKCAIVLCKVMLDHFRLLLLSCAANPLLKIHYGGNGLKENGTIKTSLKELIWKFRAYLCLRRYIGNCNSLFYQCPEV